MDTTLGDNYFSQTYHLIITLASVVINLKKNDKAKKISQDQKYEYETLL